MDSSDLSLIRPVSGLQKPSRVSETGPREQRRRQPGQDRKREAAEQEASDVKSDAPAPPPAPAGDDPHTIDFCA
jgi:hypothetical protein